MFYLLSFLFGASLGSFVQVVATRLNVAKVMTTRSKCLSCGEALRAHDLIPILSYLFLKGKCRYCKTSYGITSLIVEIAFGIVFVLLYHFIFQHSPSVISAALWLLYYSLLCITLGVIALYDKVHTYIPVYYLIAYLALTSWIWVLRYAYNPSWTEIAAPFLIAMPFFLIWLFSKGRALGFGDVVLFFGVGAFFGLTQGVAVFLISIWVGAIVGAVIYFLKPQSERKNLAIPFVPFIVFAFLFVLFTDIDIFSIASLFA